MLRDRLRDNGTLFRGPEGDTPPTTVSGATMNMEALRPLMPYLSDGQGNVGLVTIPHALKQQLSEYFFSFENAETRLHCSNRYIDWVSSVNSSQWGNLWACVDQSSLAQDRRVAWDASHYSGQAEDAS